MKHEVLVVEDDALIRMLAVEAFEDAGFIVHEAESALGAVAVLAANMRVSAIFTDINLGNGPSGIDLAAMVADQYPETVIVITSGRCQFNPAEFPRHARFMPKPYLLDAIVDAVRQAVSVRPTFENGLCPLQATKIRVGS